MSDKSSKNYGIVEIFGYEIEKTRSLVGGGF
jgi:hypothetical protein